MKTTTHVLSPYILTEAAILTEAPESTTITMARASRRRPSGWVMIFAGLLLGFVAYQVAASTYRLNHLLDEAKVVFETPIR